jgi:hypothetical protein
MVERMYMIHIAEIFAAGIIAAYVMFLTNWIAFRTGLIQVSVVEVFNEFLTQFKLKKVPFDLPVAMPRALVRLFFGGVFALLYWSFIAVLPSHTSWSIMTMCTVLGFVHGFGVGTLDAIVVAEGHPVAAYREFGHQVILTHITSHVVFGLTLGLLFSFMV